MKPYVSKMLSPLNFQIPRRFDHATIRVPVIGGIRVGIRGEPWMLQLLKKVLPLKPGTFIDVGVNLGQTLIKLKSVEPERRYVGFEPNTVCVTYVNKLVNVNHYQNCTVIPAGLFSESKILGLNLYQSSSTDSSASMITGLRPENEIKSRIYVPVVSFEQVAELLDLSDIGVIKVDVEGAELEVFESMLPTLQQQRPLILVEIIPVQNDGERARSSRQEKIENLFQSLNYSIYRINKTTSADFINLEPIDAIGFHDNILLRDYLIMPNESIEALRGLTVVP